MAAEKPWRAAVPALLALLLLAAFHALVLDRTSSDLGALGCCMEELSPGYSRFLGAYLFFGLVATAALVVALHRGLLPSQLGERFAQQLAAGPDRSFILAISLLAFALGCLSYQLLLQKMPLTEDEGAYRLAAQTLAKGRLFLPSDPDKDFFDHVFIVNNGRYFTQYFLGWPALLLPFLLLGIAGYANAFYFALTLPAIFLVLRHASDSTWARLGALLAVSSPLLVISAGTLLSHSSCLCMLAWCTYCALRCREENASWRWHALFAAFFSLAFVIRPLTAVGILLPLLAVWLWDLRARRHRLSALLALGLVALPAAGAFFAVNTALTGSPFKTSYDAYHDYRFPDREPVREETDLGLASPASVLSLAAVAFHRLGFAALGWPCSWLFVFFAGAGRGRRLLLAMIPSFFLANLFTVSVGIDAYAPMHYLELYLPILLLTVLGLENLSRAGTGLDADLASAGRGGLDLAALPGRVALASVLVMVTFFLPYQLAALNKLVRLEAIARKVDELPKPALIFVQQPYFARDCFDGGMISWVHQAPLNSPDLDDEVLWLAHLSLERNRELAARRFPQRRAFMAFWLSQGCQRVYIPLELAPEKNFPPIIGRVRF